MTLDEPINDVSCLYVAKHFLQYLRIEFPSSEKEKEVEDFDEWRQQRDKAYANYLASAGINTEEGKTAWSIAHFAGLHFQRIIWNNYDAETKCILEGEELRHDKPATIEITLNPKEMEKNVQFAIIDGLYCDRAKAFVKNKDEFQQKASRWLSTEIKQILQKGLEFNLLDAVAVKKSYNGLVYLRIDDRKPY